MHKLRAMFLTPLRSARWGALVLVSALAAAPAAAQAPVVAAQTSDAAALRQHVYAMEQAYAQVQDYTATFYKQERVKGRLLPVETMQLKFRKPFSVYLRWIGGGFEGREVLYVRGWNEDKIRAHQGSFPDVTVNLRPDASLAMRGNRHPITQLGFGEVIKLMVRDARLSEVRPQDGVRYVDHGESTVYGARSRCIEATAPVRNYSPYYATRAKICFNVKTKMPTRITVWDDEDNMIEEYGFEDVKLNVGLGDADFDPENPSYNF
jgi:outer membrane lipoprotein-sorting protein